MKKIIVESYSYEELPEPIKAKVRERFKEAGYLEGEWYAEKFDEWTKFLEQVGYYNIDIQFSGFSSQGDGASFTADLDVEKYLKDLCEGSEEYKPILVALKNGDIEIDEATIKRDRWHRYVHWNTTTFYFIIREVCGDRGLQDSSKFSKAIEQLNDHIFAEHQTFNRQIYDELAKIYDSLMQDEVVDSEIVAMDVSYLADGKPINVDVEEIVSDDEVNQKANIELITQPKIEDNARTDESTERNERTVLAGTKPGTELEGSTQGDSIRSDAGTVDGVSELNPELNKESGGDNTDAKAPDS